MIKSLIAIVFLSVALIFTSQSNAQGHWIIRDGRSVTDHLIHGYPGLHSPQNPSFVYSLSVSQQYNLHDRLHEQTRYSNSHSHSNSRSLGRTYHTRPAFRSYNTYRTYRTVRRFRRW